MTVGRRGFLVAVAVLAALAAGERWLVPRWLASRGPMGPARWISAPPAERDWAKTDSRELPPLGFFAFRDFEIAGEPKNALLRVTGDEQFWVNLNGSVVAAGNRRLDTRLVVSEVGPHLREGGNRIVVELRSPWPTGAVLLSLEVESTGGSPGRIVSDAGWSVVRRNQPELGEAGQPIDNAVPAHVWGAPPTGRWGWPREETRRPPLVELLLPGGPTPAQRARVGDPAGTWFRLPARPEQAAPLANWLTFDFGEPQVGLLSIAFGRQAAARGLVYTGMTPPDPRTERPDAVLLKLEGLNAWTDVSPRRLRYVTVLSPTKIVGARVYPVARARARRQLAESSAPRGVFGLEVGLRTPVEDEIWRDLERLARHGGG